MDKERIEEPIDLNRKEGHPRFYELLEQYAKLHSRKNTDYAKGGKQGPLGNFSRVSSIMSLYPGMDWDSSFGVALCYMLKQLDAALILRSTKRESIAGEPIPIRLADVAVYATIARIIWEEETGFNKEPQERSEQIPDALMEGFTPGSLIRFPRE